MAKPACQLMNRSLQVQIGWLAEDVPCAIPSRQREIEAPEHLGAGSTHGGWTDADSPQNLFETSSKSPRNLLATSSPDPSH
jgi:hypothetical protein